MENESQEFFFFNSAFIGQLKGIIGGGTSSILALMGSLACQMESNIMSQTMQTN